MIPLETLATFSTASVLLALAPGPDNIFVLTQSALRGPIAGLLVPPGLCTGVLVHTTAVAFGVAAIFQVSALAFTLLKLFGAGYLLYLAWRAFRASAESIAGDPADRLDYAKLYRRGIIMSVTNPKVSIFFPLEAYAFVDDWICHAPATVFKPSAFRTSADKPK
jgi:threonine/homoserine/homoserine lactone efflux protein